MSRNKAPPAQLGLGSLFEQAALEERTEHLPSTLDEAVPVYAALLQQFHDAVMRGDDPAATAAHREAEDLAVRLNGGRFGYLRDEDAPGNALMRRTAAPDGQPPLWGQQADFTVAVRDVRVRAEFAGMFGIAFPSFSAHAVDWDKPFISETGYRSFLSHSYDWRDRSLPQDFVRESIEHHIDTELKGRLTPILDRYRERHSPGQTEPPAAEDGPTMADAAVESTGGPHQDTVLPVSPEGDSTPVGDGPVLSRDFNRERTDPMPKRNKAPPLETDIAKLVTGFAHRHGAWQVFSDFCEMAATSLSNAVDLAEFEKREARYMEIIKRYTRDELAQFPQMLAALTNALEAQTTDVLGRTFHELELHSKWAGQFFTPYPLCRMMAQMSLRDEAEIRAKIEGRGFISASEPAVGSGAMVIALAQGMRDMGINYQQHLHVTAADVDAKCVHMAYAQLSLLHVPAVIIHGNSLTLEEWGHWYTPAHILGGWPGRLKRAEDDGHHVITEMPPPREDAEGPPDSAPEAPPRGQQLELL